MDTLLVIMSLAVFLLLIGCTIFAVYLVRWMKRRDHALAETLRESLRQRHELNQLRKEKKRKVNSE